MNSRAPLQHGRRDTGEDRQFGIDFRTRSRRRRECLSFAPNLPPRASPSPERLALTRPRNLRSNLGSDTRHLTDADRLRAAAGEEALARVRRITRATEAMLLERKYGPAANPARRFAIWALYRRGVKQREIAERMRTTYYQVSRLLGRLRNEKARDPLRRWMQDWVESE